MNKRAKGRFYEDMAAGYLMSLSYEILKRNFSSRMGEIDIVARDGETLVFVEVKYRRSASLGYPSEAVGATKQRNIRRVAQYYMMKNSEEDREVRFDVVEILGDRISLIKNAF